MEEVANGGVHPVAKKTITKYKKPIANLLLQDNWMKSVCKALGRLSKKYGKKGTDEYAKDKNTFYSWI